MALREIHRRSSSSFEPKVELGNTWNPRQINSTLNRGFPGVTQWRKLILRKSVAIECQPISKPGYPVAEVHARAPVTWVIGASWQESVTQGVAPQKRVPRKRARATRKNSRSRNAKLKVGCRLQANFLPLQERLAI